MRKARRSEALETEVKRLRDKLVEQTLELDGATDRGRKEARLGKGIFLDFISVTNVHLCHLCSSFAHLSYLLFVLFFFCLVEYEKELARRERTSNSSSSTTNVTESIDIQMFEATAQELDMAQTKLAQTRSDLEQERKRNMRLHRLRMAAEEEIEKAKETLNILSSEGERERERSSEYERTIEDLKEDLRDANERVENAGRYCVLCLIGT